MKPSSSKDQLTFEICPWEGRYEHKTTQIGGRLRNTAGVQQDTWLIKETSDEERPPTTPHAPVLQTTGKSRLGWCSMHEASSGWQAAASSEPDIVSLTA